MTIDVFGRYRELKPVNKIKFKRKFQKIEEDLRSMKKDLDENHLHLLILQDTIDKIINKFPKLQ